jgi:hypothetical protein
VQAGHVYIVGPLEGCFKIGCTRQLPERLAFFDFLPVRMAVQITIPSDRHNWLEKYLHAAFAAKRVRGEWFRLTDGELDSLREVPFAHQESDLPKAVIVLNRARCEEVRLKKILARKQRPKRVASRTNISFPPELRRKLKEAAQRNGMTVEGAVRKWFTPVVDREHRKSTKGL